MGNSNRIENVRKTGLGEYLVISFKSLPALVSWLEEGGYKVKHAEETDTLRVAHTECGMVIYGNGYIHEA